MERKLSLKKNSVSFGVSKLPIFITGNQHKADYLSRQLGVAIEHQKVELDELQSTDIHAIVEHKLRQAYRVIGAPVLVEDVSLSFTALGELPGRTLNGLSSTQEKKPVAACSMVFRTEVR